MKVCYENIFAKHYSKWCNITIQVWLYSSQLHYKHCSIDKFRKITYFSNLRGDPGQHALHLLHIRSRRTFSGALENYPRLTLSPKPEAKLKQKLFMLPHLQALFITLNRGTTCGSGEWFCLLSPLILPKVLINLTLQQKIPPLPTLDNKLQLWQGICSASLGPGTLPREMNGSCCPQQIT